MAENSRFTSSQLVYVVQTCSPIHVTDHLLGQGVRSKNRKDTRFKFNIQFIAVAFQALLVQVWK